MPEGLGRPEGKPDGKGKGKDGGKPDYAYGKTDLAKGKVRDYPGKGTPAASPPARTVEGLPSRPPLPGGLPAIGARPTHAVAARPPVNAPPTAKATAATAAPARGGQSRTLAMTDLSDAVSAHDVHQLLDHFDPAGAPTVQLVSRGGSTDCNVTFSSADVSDRCHKWLKSNEILLKGRRVAVSVEGAPPPRSVGKADGKVTGYLGRHPCR